MATVHARIDEIIADLEFAYDDQASENDGPLIKQKMKANKIRQEKQQMLAILTATKAEYLPTDLLDPADDSQWTDIFS